MAKKFPFFKQHDAMDCGATCLRMITSYYGKSYPIEHLRDITHLTREGVSFADIGEAAEKIGIRSLAVKLSFSQLLNEVPLPCIAHWNQEHFVVIYQVKENEITIGDPAKEILKLSKAEFLQSWAVEEIEGIPNGILLLLEPSPEFYTSDSVVETNSKSNIFKYLLPYKRLIIQLLLGLLVGSCIQLSFPFLTQSLVDTGIQHKDIDFVYIILIASVMLFIGKLSIEFLRGWILLHIGTRINIHLISDFLIKLMKLPVSYFEKKMTGDLLQRISDNHRIEQFLTSSALLTFFSFFNLVIFGFVLSVYSLKIFFIFLVFTALDILWLFYFMKKRRLLDYKRFEQMSANQSQLLQIINGIKEIKLHNAERQKRWRWEYIQTKLFRINIQFLATDQYQRAGANLINEIKNISITIVAAKLVIDGKLTLGMMLSMQYIIGQLNSPLEAFVSFIQNWQEAKISLERLDDIQNSQQLEDIGEFHTHIPENQDIIFENVQLKYGGESSPSVLKNINLVIPHGKTTAIVGTSGSGKTSLLKLILNFYQPTKGTIKIGGTNINQIKNSIWRDQIGVVMQEGFIFNDSIEKNITLGTDFVDQKKLIQAVKIANIQSFIESLPISYATKIGDEGLGLSQGQKQRLLIARAIYKNPNIILFDEATNALDAYNEMIIMDNLNDFLVQKTVVIVAHRLSTVIHADKIIVLEDGEIIEEGNHQTLIQSKGAYYHLIKNQLELGQ
ncbi:MAG: peptidase domain-containing ABC transporter [Saprospiraceae bacterium]|nr:peptidase domain-containing ABC transporter [Saprospiraceae bacterium]